MYKYKKREGLPTSSLNYLLRPVREQVHLHGYQIDLAWIARMKRHQMGLIRRQLGQRAPAAAQQMSWTWGRRFLVTGFSIAFPPIFH